MENINVLLQEIRENDEKLRQEETARKETRNRGRENLQKEEQKKRYLLR